MTAAAGDMNADVLAPMGVLPSLTILYPDMAPSIMPDSLPGSVRGALAERIRRVAGRAGIALQWKGPLPRNRILMELLHGSGSCTPYVLKTRERERLFKFTVPLLPAPDWVVVTRKGMIGRLPQGSFTELLKDASLVMVRQQGHSLGADLDRLIDEQAAHIRFVRGDVADMISAVRKGYADYTLTTSGELALPARGYRQEDFDVVRYPDLKNVGAGHIMCSSDVSDTLINALDQAITSLPVTTVDGQG